MPSASFLLCVCFASLSYISCEILYFLRGPTLSGRQDEVPNNGLTMRQGGLEFPLQDDIVQFPVEDPNIRLARPAGGEVVRGGAGIMGIMSMQGVAEPVTTTTTTTTAASSSTSTRVMHDVVRANGNRLFVFGQFSGAGTAIPVSVATSAASIATVPTPVSTATGSALVSSTTVAAAGSTIVTATASLSPTPSTAVTLPPTGNPSTGNASTPFAGVGGTTVGGATVGTTSPGGPIITVTTAGSIVGGTTTAAYGSGYTSAAPITVAATTAAYGSSYGSSSSSYGSSSGSTSGSGTFGPLSSVNSIGVPYGVYPNIQYVPYAPNAANQLGSPLIFSPYLPEPSYINKYFGLNLPLVQGRR